MARLLARFLALALFLGAAQALNPLFLAMGDSQCDTCQDAAYNTCPGDYEGQTFAECMCAGDGASLYAGTCIPLCTAASGLGADYFVVTLYSYCIGFFPQFCESAEQAGVSQNLLDKYCSADAGSSSGSGSGSGSDSGSGGSGSGTGSSTGSRGSGSSSNGPQVTTTGSSPSGSGSSTTGSGSAATGTTETGAPNPTTSKAAAALAVSPAWGGVVFGLGMHLMGL